MVTFASHPATLPADDYPWGSTPEQRARLLEAISARLKGVPDSWELYAVEPAGS